MMIDLLLQPRRPVLFCDLRADPRLREWIA